MGFNGPWPSKEVASYGRMRGLGFRRNHNDSNFGIGND